MGPRSHERGNPALKLLDPFLGRLASMGPRSHERGNPITKPKNEGKGKRKLQWGRVLMNAETISCST